MKIHRYWKSELTPNNQPTDDKINDIQDVLRESVYLHMQSEKRIGAFLSGGVDSSAIVALAQEIDPGIKTFTVGFKREGYNEINVAKKTAEQLNIDNIHYVIHPDEFVGHLRTIIYYLDTPIADPAAIPLYFAAREAKKYVDIVLSGEGADEFFGGYNIYREPYDLKIFNHMPLSLKKMLNSLANHIPEGVRGKSFLKRGTTNLAERFIGNAHMFSEEEKKHLLTLYNEEHHFTNITAPIYKQVEHLHETLQMQSIDIHTWLRDDILIKANRMTNAHTLELRLPFLDKEVFKVASGLQPYESITKETTKHAMREAMRGIVPDSVLYNRKLGFPVPIRHWLRNELYDWAKEIIENSPTDEIIETSYVLELLETHRTGKTDNSRKLWTVICFMIWHEIFVESDDVIRWNG